MKKTLGFLEEKGSEAIDYASVEIPEIIRQYLVFEVFRYGFYIFLGILFMTLIVRMCRSFVTVRGIEEPTNCKNRYKYVKVRKNRWLKIDSDPDDYRSSEEVLYNIIIPIGCNLVGIILILANIVTFIKITFFPKLYLVEKFIQLL